MFLNIPSDTSIVVFFRETYEPFPLGKVHGKFMQESSSGILIDVQYDGVWTLFAVPFSSIQVVKVN